MGNSIRCCLACVLPCGALDLVRIVHINGHVEEYGRPVSAGEVLDANPNHVISKPSSQGGSRRIVILSPDSELKRGNIYFLIPASAFPERKKKSDKSKHKKKHAAADTGVGFRDLETDRKDSTATGHHRRRKSGPVAVWRPHLESIYED